jgi:hypothetical protein
MNRLRQIATDRDKVITENRAAQAAEAALVAEKAAAAEVSEQDSSAE